MTAAPALSPEDIEVLRRVAGGFSEKEIASDLRVCRQSVGRRIAAIRERAGITQFGTRRPLVLLARQLGLEVL